MNRLAISLLLLISIHAHAEFPVILNNGSLEDFVSWYAEETGHTVILAPGTEATLTVYAPSVTPDALPELFRSVIISHGLEITGTTDLVISKPQQEDPGNPEDEPQNLITQVHIFQNTLADDVRDFTSSFITGSDSKTDRSPAVHVIRSLNALAVTTTEEQHRLYSSLLTHLDTSRPLIHLEAVIFENSGNSGLDLGVSYGQTGLDSGSGSGTGFDSRSGFGTGTGSMVGGFDLNGLNQLPGSGFAFGLLNDQQLSFVLNALQSDVDAHILSKPQILIMSGEEGVISVGQNVPFLASTTMNNGQTTQSIERRDVGVSLTVRPFISQQGQIILALTLKADSINQSIQASDIITNTRNIKTTVQLQAGQSISLGGLITTEEEQRVRKVPLLGSIPYLGALFRSTSTQTTERELNIILRASNVSTFSADVPTL